MILGGGPNRIGQGIEFDYCCVHAAFALKEAGFETIMVNCNPETVSHRLRHLGQALLRAADARGRARDRRARDARRRDRPVRRADAAQARGAARSARACRSSAPSPDSIDRAEDRERFATSCASSSSAQPRERHRALGGRGRSRSPTGIGYPVLVRPSYVLGGRAMEIVYERAISRGYMRRAVAASPGPAGADRPFLEDAIEVDVDAISDGRDVVIGGIMEHIERAGVHSGDSACALPPISISTAVQDEIRRQTVALARELGVVGLMNVQFAVQRDRVYILEVNPRASRTVPFVSKAIGVPLAKLAARVMAGRDARRARLHARDRAAARQRQGSGVPVCQVPRRRHRARPGDEVDRRGDGHRRIVRRRVRQGADRGRHLAAARRPGVHQRAAGGPPASPALARALHALGFELVATRGTAAAIIAAGIPVAAVNKVHEGSPHAVDALCRARSRSSSTRRSRTPRRSPTRSRSAEPRSSGGSRTSRRSPPRTRRRTRSQRSSRIA